VRLLEQAIRPVTHQARGPDAVQDRMAPVTPIAVTQLHGIAWSISRGGSFMADLSAPDRGHRGGDRHTATRLTQEAIDAGVGPQEILDAMTTAMTEVGRRFACNEGVYVPEMLISARATRESSELLEPLLVAEAFDPSTPPSSALCAAICTTSARTSSA
jgi:uncharacterized protein (DUF2237 family)